MKLHHIILAMIAAVSIANGIYSPRLLMVFALQGIWYPAWLPAPLQFMFILSAAILSLLYFMVSGVPSALYEKARGQQQADVISRMVWLATVMLMSWPTVQPMLLQD